MRRYLLFALLFFVATSALGHGGGLDPRGCHNDRKRGDGGRWRLDVSPKAQTLIGRRVTVEATRSGFDLLDVHRIYPEGQTPAQPYILSWQFGAGVASTLSLLALVILLTTV